MRLPAPIRTAVAHRRALARLSEIMTAKPGTPEGDEFDLLATLIDHYERTAFPMDVPGPIAAIEFRLEQAGLDRKALEPMIGSRARVSEVMTGKRALSIRMIRALHDGLGIPLESLIVLPTRGQRRAPRAGAAARRGARKAN